MIGDRDKGYALTPVDLSAATWKKPKIEFSPNNAYLVPKLFFKK